MELCAALMSCDPPKCVCDRSKDYARDHSSEKCVKRYKCPSWTTNPCMTVKCSAGHSCVAQNGHGVCVPDPVIEPQPVPSSCAVVLCLVGSFCVEEGGVARCVAPPNNGNDNCTVQFEEWRPCATCEATCEIKVPKCSKECKPARCMCRRGFFRSKEGKCVTENDCDSAAMTTPSTTICSKDNEQFNECASACEPSCRNKDKEIACIAMCMPPSCQCKNDYYRADNGECVLADQCKKSSTPRSQADCGPNMTFRNCSSLCQSKCGDYIIKPCLPSCGPPKCECNAGFYFNRVGDCVNRADCDSEQPITCANVDCRNGMICRMQNGEPKCINQERLTCNTVKCPGGSRCLINPDGTPSCIPTITCANVRCAGPCTDTPNGPKCGPRPQVLPISVGPSSTPTPGCPINEEIRNCTNKCNEPFCGDENFARRCANVCLTPECECIEGFVRDRQKGCVKREDCTKKGENESSPCARKNCGIARRCVERRGRARCVPLFPNRPSVPVADPISSILRPFPSLPNSCDDVKCLDGGNCVMEEVKCISGPCKAVPKCRGGSSTVPPLFPGDEMVPTCDGHDCPDGQRCQLQEVVCIRAPCYPVPTCVPGGPICDLFCPFGQICTLETVFCKKAPCPQKPICRPIPMNPVPSCETLSCDFGETCVIEPIPCFVALCPNRSICRPVKKTCSKKNEVWDECFHGCENTCQERLMICTMQCGPGGCQCDTNFIRDEATGECVPERECPNKCAANEEYDRCFHGCEATCDQPNPTCTEQCGPGGCRCVSPLVRDTKTKECVQSSDCPRSIY